jgi:hypothetical protein
MANPSAFSISSSRKGSAEMSTYHVQVKAGKKGSAVKHSKYIAREQEFRNRGDVVLSGFGNMPSWALESPKAFWGPADAFERANGAVYREMIIALPRGMTLDQLLKLVEDMIPGLIGNRPYQYAVHTPESSIDGGENPHLHLMYSDRAQDGIDRAPEQYFTRYNPDRPEKGGCKKLSGGLNRLQLRDELIAKRRHVANVQNAHLALYGRTDFVDYRTLKEQGVDRPPERHLGPARIRRMGPDGRAAVVEARPGRGPGPA